MNKEKTAGRGGKAEIAKGPRDIGALILLNAEESVKVAKGVLQREQCKTDAPAIQELIDNYFPTGDDAGIDVINQCIDANARIGAIVGRRDALVLQYEKLVYEIAYHINTVLMPMTILNISTPTTARRLTTDEDLAGCLSGINSVMDHLSQNVLKYGLAIVSTLRTLAEGNVILKAISETTGLDLSCTYAAKDKCAERARALAGMCLALRDEIKKYEKRKLKPFTVPEQLVKELKEVLSWQAVDDIIDESGFVINGEYFVLVDEEVRKCVKRNRKKLGL